MLRLSNIWLCTFQKTSNSKINELLLLLFNSLWKERAKYTALCLDASAKLGSRTLGSISPHSLNEQLLDL